MSIYQKQRFEEVLPTRNSTDNNFSGQIIFDYQTGVNTEIIDDESYLYIDVEITKNGIPWVDTDAEILLRGFSNAPFACLFTTADLMINNRVVSRVDEFPQSYLIKRLAFNGNGEERIQSGNPVNIEDLTQVGPSRALYSNTGDAVIFADSPSIWRRAKNAQQSGLYFSANGRPTLAMKLSTLFDKKGIVPLPPASKMQWRFQVDPLYRELMVVTGEGLDDVGGVYTVAVKELHMYLSVYERVPITPDYSYRAEYVDLFSTTQTLSATTTHRFHLSIPEGCNRLLCCLFDSSKTNVSTPTIFSSDSIANLTRFRLTYAGQTFPDPDYQFSANLLDRDKKRAYEQFLRETQSLMSASGNSLSFGQWCACPMYVFRVVRPPGSRHTTVQVELDFSAAVAVGTTFYLGAMYDKELTVQYNEMLQPVTTTINEL